jgi:hypothetical protein
MTPAVAPMLAAALSAGLGRPVLLRETVSGRPNLSAEASGFP